MATANLANDLTNAMPKILEEKGNQIMDKRALAQKIKALDGLSNDEKSALLELLHERKKYGIVWEDKPENVEIQMASELPVLTEVKERAIISDDTDAPNHILIEGDNLHALTALSYTHAGKIDVIYIDPPYNTGNKDFIFNDSYVDKEDSYHHSKWLSFMSKRLEIAKGLLSDRGVIFISLNDIEQPACRMLCDSVFGENNFCGQVIWRKKSGGGQTDEFFVTEHEYILVYRKTPLFIWVDDVIESNAGFNKEDSGGKFKAIKLEKWGSSAHKEDRLTMWFPIKTPDGKNMYPVAPDGLPGRWRVGKKRMEDLEKHGWIYWEKKGDRWVPYEKVYSEDDNLTKIKKVKCRSIFYDEGGETGDASNTLTDIFGKKDAFQNPKPVYLIEELISHTNAAMVLDFFAGSGTTLHATMQLNAEDSGHRQCILITNNENNICEEITYERNRRVIQGYTTPKGEAVEGLHSNTLRYYKTGFVPRTPSLKNRWRLMSVSTDLLCIKNNVYQEQNLFCGKKWKNACLRFFANERTQMLIIYNEQTIPFVVSALKSTKLDSIIRVYVFSNSRYVFEDDFAEILDKVELCALPAAIYDAYQNVLPPLPPEFLEEEVENHD